uniref:DUF6745 domain-containing protein n=1 Tax=Thalassoglobus neptunius TaxID=1938619 RepID=UPI0036F40E94
MSFYDFFRTVCDLRKETDKLIGLIELSQHCGWWIPYKHVCILQHRHSELHLNSEGRLHNESGMAFAYPDGWGGWFIDGIRVDEKIVMHPETQTIEEIETEGNNDVKSIRVERFGWYQYLKESGAELVDSRSNNIENTKEALFELRDGARRYVATCPSGKRVCLGVPKEIATCEQSQSWMAGAFGDRQSIGRT